MEYYQRIKGLREDNDKSQKEIAQVLGTEQSYYAKYENGKRPLPIDRLKKLCEYYSELLKAISLAYLAHPDEDQRHSSYF